MTLKVTVLIPLAAIVNGSVLGTKINNQYMYSKNI